MDRRQPRTVLRSNKAEALAKVDAVTCGKSDVNGLYWRLSKDGDATLRALYERHYSVRCSLSQEQE